MPENEWTWLALAPARIGTHDAPQRLKRAWLEGALFLRGVPHAIPETQEVVDIPASEAGHLLLDCARSRIVRLSSQGRRRLTYYRSVQVRTADIERLAGDARGNRAADTAVAQEASPAVSTPQEQTRQSADTLAPKVDPAVAVVGEEASPPVSVPVEQTEQSAAETLTLKATPRVRAVAGILRKEWPERPDKSVDGMLTHVRTKTRPVSKSTLERAIRLLQAQGQWGK
jgi:hypothetical protein